MPRVSKAQTDRNRLAITEAAARLFRERGIKGVSVAELMAAAGLTHGGFYGHFGSKDALAAEACSSAFAESAARWTRRVAGATDRGAARAALIEAYLARPSRTRFSGACPAAALAGDVAREAEPAPVRAAYLAGLQRLLDMLASLQRGRDAAADRQQALADFSTMVGALVLARATAGDTLADELFAAARARLLAPPAPPLRPARRKRGR